MRAVAQRRPRGPRPRPPRRRAARAPPRPPRRRRARRAATARASAAPPTSSRIAAPLDLGRRRRRRGRAGRARARRPRPRTRPGTRRAARGGAASRERRRDRRRRAPGRPRRWCADEGHHGHAEPRGERRARRSRGPRARATSVMLSATHDGQARLEHLRREVEVALEVGRVDHDDDRVGPRRVGAAAEQHVHRDHLVGRARGEAVGARQVEQRARPSTRRAAGPDLLLDGHARVVRHVARGSP